MSLAGIWYNELGSEMVLHIDWKRLTGTFVTGVGGIEGTYKLVGMADPNPSSAGQAFGFVISWAQDMESKATSVTVWSGQYQIIKNQEQLTTTWLMTTETEASDDWASTLIGHDIFRREVPSEVDINWRKKRGPSAYPVRPHV